MVCDLLKHSSMQMSMSCGAAIGTLTRWVTATGMASDHTSYVSTSPSVAFTNSAGIGLLGQPLTGQVWGTCSRKTCPSSLLHAAVVALLCLHYWRLSLLSSAYAVDG